MATPDNISRDSTKERIEMFFCLMPVFGLIPSAIALVRQRSSRKVRDVSQVAISLMLTWAIVFLDCLVIKVRDNGRVLISPCTSPWA